MTLVDRSIERPTSWEPLPTICVDSRVKELIESSSGFAYAPGLGVDTNNRMLGARLPVADLLDEILLTSQPTLDGVLGRLTTTPIVGPVEKFLEKVYGFRSKRGKREAVGFIFRQFNKWLNIGWFDLCDAVLFKADLNQLDTDLTLAFLTITRAAREKLPHRVDYLQKARIRITQLRGPEVAETLLRHMAD